MKRSRKIFRNTTITGAIVAVFLACGGIAVAADFMIYPNKGQSQKKQDQDQYECYSWAKNKSGFDPMAAPTATSPPPAGDGANPVRGAAGGALAGVAIGAIAGDAGKGAAIGAASGALLGGARRRNQYAQQQQWANQQAANYSNNRTKYNRAFSACMEGRGYTVR
jgi:hypothetical protein